ncbi:hypothetical protein BH09SUM1_BH09SUM1_18130 [soil metagenome]
MHRLLLFLFAALTLTACASAQQPPAKPAAKRPNIILIFSDDHGWQTISAYSKKLMKTPNLDRIANEGMLFQKAYVPNPICGPSRACVLTGKYSHVNGYYWNGKKPFNTDQWCFPRSMQGAGYETAIIGKWHLGDEAIPPGFNFSSVLTGQGPYYNPVFLQDVKGDGVREKVSFTGYTTDIITDEAIKWLDGRGARGEGEKPFMLMVQNKAPHRPWMPNIKDLDEFENDTIPEPPTLFEDYTGMPRAARIADMRIADTMNARDLKLEEMPGLNDEQRAAWNAVYGPRNAAFRALNLKGADLVRWKYQRYIKDYMRCIRSVDDNVGRLLNYLDEKKLTENTIVIYCSDQGFFLGEHGWFDKRWIYEESLKTPFMVRWPGHTKPGTESSDIVSVIDLAPTFCDIAGAPIPEDVQGRSIVQVLDGKTPDDWRKSFYFHYYEYPGWHAVRRHYGVSDGRYKLAYFYEMDMDEWLLVDLQADPLEQHNFYNDPKYADVQARLTEELKRLRTELKEPEKDPLESYPVGDPY